MKVSGGLLNAIAAVEGAHATEYTDIAGVRTIGVGHVILKTDVFLTAALGKRYEVGDKLTDKQILKLLSLDISKFENAVRKFVKVPLKQHQFDALVMFTFNVGVGAFKRSTLLRKLNEGDYEEVSNQIMRWNKARVRGKLRPVQGLINRREMERQIFFMGTELETLNRKFTFRFNDMAFIADVLGAYNEGRS